MFVDVCLLFNAFLHLYMPNILIHHQQIALTHSSPLSRSSTVHFPARTFLYVIHRLISDSNPAVDHDRYHCFDLNESFFFAQVTECCIIPVLNKHLLHLHGILSHLKDEI